MLDVLFFQPQKLCDTGLQSEALVSSKDILFRFALLEVAAWVSFAALPLVPCQ